MEVFEFFMFRFFVFFRFFFGVFGDVGVVYRVVFMILSDLRSNSWRFVIVGKVKLC